jgi:hypothetical protein
MTLVLILIANLQMSEARSSIDGCVDMAYVFCPSWDFDCVVHWWIGCIKG